MTRVLIVDDKDSNRTYLEALLATSGCTVEVARNGSEALLAAQRMLPDLVISDLLMPVMDGYTLLRHWKEDERLSRVPFIVYTATYTAPEDEALAMSYGADAFILKPTEPDVFMALIQAVQRRPVRSTPTSPAPSVDSQESLFKLYNQSLIRKLEEKSLELEKTNKALEADIAKRVSAEQSLRTRESQFRAAEGRHQMLIETAHEGICTLDGAGVVTYANPRLATILGLKAEKLVGRPLFDFISEAQQFSARTRFARRYRGLSETEEIEMRRDDGGLVWVLASSSQIVDGDGLFAGVLVMLTDVTKRKQSELATGEALHQADLDRRRLEATLNAIPIGVWLSDETGRLTHSNPAAAEIWGGDAPHSASVAEYAVYKAWNPATGQPVEPDQWALARTLATGQVISNELVEIERFDGNRAFILNSAAPIRDSDGRITGGVVVNVDLTERHAAMRERENLARQLELERTHLVAIFDLAPEFLAVLRGPDYVFERVNAAYYRLVGQRPLLGKPVLEAIPELAGQGFEAVLRQVRETGETVVAKDVPISLVRESGKPLEMRFVNVVYQRLMDHRGDVIVVHGWDATEQVKANEALERSERRLQDQFDKLPVPTHLWELDGDDFVLIEANEEALRATPELHGSIGMRARDIYPDPDEVVRGDMRRCLRDDVVIKRSVTQDYGGSIGVRHFDMTIGPQPPNRVLIHAVDTSESRALELQLRQAQKMEAIGQLAGGVAHDFNNLLTVIGSHSDFLLESLGSDDPNREDAKAIHDAGVRAAGLTRQLLAFSRKQLLRPVLTDLNEIVTEASRMLTRLLGDEISVVLSLSNDLGSVMADPGQLDQVLINLAVNARDAMPDGGRLEINTHNVTLAENADLALKMMPRGDYTLLEVTDTGIGMSAEVKGRLFEPFFTTKAQGKGTGLGLATAYGIVKQANGFITVESSPGNGATFSVYLPRVSEGEQREMRQTAASQVARGTETILLVEDEPSVRELVTRVLKQCGYHVLAAKDGFEALSLSASFEATIDLVLSDAAMPGMTGGETVRRLKEQRPSLKAVFMSGHTDDEILRRGVALSEVSFLEKPFAREDLARLIREALDR